MIIDIDHMGALTANRTLQICEEVGYPIVSGHTGFVALSIGDKASEGQKSAEQLERIRRLGGVVAPILHPGGAGEIWQYGNQVPHSCGDSSRSFAQAYLYAIDRMKGAAVAIGSDFNGLAGAPGGRFRDFPFPGPCSPLTEPNPVVYPFLTHGEMVLLDKSRAGNKAWDYNTDGFAHIGLYPDFIEDFKNIGVRPEQLELLFRSAEAYIRMWERIESRSYVACPPAQPAGFNLSTGFDDALGSTIASRRADDNYEVEGPPGFGISCAAVVPDDQYPIGPWMGSTNESRWIGLPALSSAGPPGIYVYRTTVNIPAGVDLGTLVIQGGFASDDPTRDVRINGASTGIQTDPVNGFTALTPFPPQAGRRLFRSGDNTIEFLVENLPPNQNPTGLRVEAAIRSLEGMDLAVESVQLPSAEVMAGERLALTDTCANLPASFSTARAAQLRYSLYVLERPKLLKVADLGSRPLGTLAPGATSQGTILTAAIPAELFGLSFQLHADLIVPPPESDSNLSNNHWSFVPLTILPAASTRFFSENFDSVDPGPPATLTAQSCDWTVSKSALQVGPTPADGESWIWAGNKPITAPRRMTYSFDYRFIQRSSVPIVGRHGGFAFCANRPLQRFDPAFSGYTADWIDRSADRGFRVSRWNSQIETKLAAGLPGMPAAPPVKWRIEVTDDRIRVVGDGTLYVDVADPMLGGGHFEFFAWGNDQIVSVDNILAENVPFAADFSFGPATAVKGDPVSFDGGLTNVSQGLAVTSYDWNFGDGATASGVTASHTYASNGTFSVTLTARDSLGRVSAQTKSVPVYESLLPFADCFDGQKGDQKVDPVKWRVETGSWTVSDEALSFDSARGDGRIWAGSGTRLVGGDFTAEFDMTPALPQNPLGWTGLAGGCRRAASRSRRRRRPRIPGTRTSRARARAETPALARAAAPR